MTKNNNFTFLLGSTIGAVYVLVYLNYPGFFIWNPLTANETFLGFLQVASSIAWVIATFVPSIFWIVGSSFSSARSVAYLATSLLWPSVISTLHIYLFFTSGNANLSYLFNFPIFIFTDIIAPIIYVQMWRKFRSVKPQDAGLETNNFLFDSTKSR
jgi:hypothetical protein